MPKYLRSGVCIDSQKALVSGPEYPCAMSSETSVWLSQQKGIEHISNKFNRCGYHGALCVEN